LDADRGQICEPLDTLAGDLDGLGELAPRPNLLAPTEPSPVAFYKRVPNGAMQRVADNEVCGVEESRALTGLV
jgi:hypothetical protein